MASDPRIEAAVRVGYAEAKKAKVGVLEDALRAACEHLLAALAPPPEEPAPCGISHHTGCACHEARHAEEVAEWKRRADDTGLALGHEQEFVRSQTEEIARLRTALDAAESAIQDATDEHNAEIDRLREERYALREACVRIRQAWRERLSVSYHDDEANQLRAALGGEAPDA